MPSLIPEHEREPLPSAFLKGDWVNAQRPPTIEDLRGSPTLILPFSARDPIACAYVRHAQTQARQAGVKTLGVHVPEEPHGTKRRTVSNAVLREGLRVPIRYDPSSTNDLPTHGCTVLLDAHARMAAHHKGPPTEETFDLARKLDDEPTSSPSWGIRGDAPPPTELLFPQGLAASEGFLVVADTAHHRILLRRDDTVERFGSGAPGHRDGSADDARFRRPRDVLLHEDVIIVADTGNGALRRILPDEGSVDTLVDKEALQGDTINSPVGAMPWGLATDPHTSGAIVTALMGHDLLVRVDVAEGIVQPLHQEGNLHSPMGVASNEEHVFVSEPARGRITRVDPTTGALRVFLPEDASVVAPAGLDHANGMLAIADPYAGVVHLFDVANERLVNQKAAGAHYGLFEPWTAAFRGDAVVSVGDDHQLKASRGSPGAGWSPLPGLVSRGDGVSRLDPVEVAPGGRLVLEVGVGGLEAGSGSMGPLTVRGPVEVDDVRAWTRRGERVWSRVEVLVVASGRVEVSWGLERVGVVGSGRELPVVVRRGGREVESVQVSGRVVVDADEERSP